MNNRAYRSATLIQEILSNATNSAEGLAMHADIIDQFCTNMPDDSVTYVWAYKTQVGLQVRGDGTLLAMAMRFLATRGWKLEGERPQPKSASWEGRYVHPELASAPRITLTWTSTLCKRVKVGTKTVTQEVDVYETQCDDPMDVVAEDPVMATEDDREPPERELPAEEP